MKNKIFSIVCALLMAITTSAATTLPIKGTIISPTNPNICYVGRISFKTQSDRCSTGRNPNHSALRGNIAENDCQAQKWLFRMYDRQCRTLQGELQCTTRFRRHLGDSTAKRHTRGTADVCHRGDRTSCGVQGFVLDEHCSLAQPPALPERRIEFIGNSITCSFGIESGPGR